MGYFLFAVIVMAVLFIIDSKTKNNTTKGPVVSRGDYNSHLDFLESHGFITAEERRQQREFEEDFKLNPEKYEVITWEELVSQDKESKK